MSKISNAEVESNQRAADLRVGIDRDALAICPGCGMSVPVDEAHWGVHCDPYSMFNTGA